MTEYVVDFPSNEINDLVIYERLVRCKDCEHGLFGGKTCDRLDPGFDEYWFEVEPDGYCAWPERRTND